MNKKGMIQIIGVILIILLIAIVFFGIKLNGKFIFGESREYDPLAEKLSQIEPLNLSSVEKYEGYKEFADKMNDLILIINEQTGTKVPKFETTQESWSKASKQIQKYSPLINNYNSLVLAAKQHKKEKTEETYQNFYKELGTFSLEFTFISATLFHQVTFNLVGGVARSLGIGSLALKCPSCASTIMSSVYWGIKGFLVESASKASEEIFNKLNVSIIKS